jgi:hypothetical protein
MMHGHEKSDSAIVATKPPNKGDRPSESPSLSHTVPVRRRGFHRDVAVTGEIGLT